MAALCPRPSDSVGPRWGLSICISNKRPGDAEDPRTPRGAMRPLGSEDKARLKPEPHLTMQPPPYFRFHTMSNHGAFLKKRH